MRFARSLVRLGARISGPGPLGTGAGRGGGPAQPPRKMNRRRTGKLPHADAMAHLLHRRAGDGAGPLRPGLQGALDRGGLGEEGARPLAHRREDLLEVGAQDLLAVETADRGAAASAGAFLPLRLRGEEPVPGEDVALRRVARVDAALPRRVGHRAGEARLDALRRLEEPDLVAEALRHLADPVESEHARGRGEDRLRLREGRAVDAVEPPRALAGE